MGLGAIDNFQETAAPVPPSPSDLLVGRTLFVSSQGLGGAIEDLTFHYSDIDTAIAALTSNAQTIVVYPGNWTINVDSPTARLNLFLHTGAVVIFTVEMAGVAALNIGGSGIVEIQTELSGCTAVTFQGEQFSVSDIVGAVGCTYSINATTEISFSGITTAADNEFCLTALLNVVFGIVDINSADATILRVTCPQIELTALNFDVNVIGGQLIEFNGTCFFTSSTTPIFITGSAQELLSDVIRFNGDVDITSDNAVVIDSAIFNFSNYNFIHRIITNGAGTANTPIFDLSAGGVILKSCNVKSVNGQRAQGIIKAATNTSYVQIDGATFSDLDNAIVAGPDVYTSPIGTTYNGLRAAYDDNFARFVNPVNITNNFVAGTAQLARLANFKA